MDDLRAPLDEEERSRIEAEDNYTLILVDIPTIEERNDRDWYETIPMGIVVTDKALITVCLEDTPILGSFHGRPGAQFLYLYEDPVHFADLVSKCQHVSALSAYHR